MVHHTTQNDLLFCASRLYSREQRMSSSNLSIMGSGRGRLGVPAIAWYCMRFYCNRCQSLAIYMSTYVPQCNREEFNS